MKRQLTLFVMTVLLAGGSGVVKANLLSNGNLDLTAIGPQTLATPTGWSVNSFKTISGPFSDGCSSETFANVLAAGGYGLFFKPFQGSQSTGDYINVDLYQDNPGTAGLTYSLTGWAGAGAGYVGLNPAGPTKSLLAIDFLDAANTVIGGGVLDLLGAGLGAGAPTAPATGFGYHPFSVTATAPAGTVTVRARASMVDGYANPNGGDQAFVVDVFDLEVVPEPSVISLALLSLAGLLAFRRRG